MVQFFFGLIAGLVVGLVMEWIVDWQALTPGMGSAARRAQAQPQGETPDSAEITSSYPVSQRASEPLESHSSAHEE